MKAVSIYGAGSFGSAFSLMVAPHFDRIWLYTNSIAQAEAINSTRINTAFLDGHTLPKNLVATTDAAEAAQDSAIAVLTVPSQATRKLLGEIGKHLPRNVPIVTAAKGIEADTLLTMTDVIEQCLDADQHRRLAVLSGPSFAVEMARRMPTVVTIASRWKDTAKTAQALLLSDVFKPFISTDVIGVQVGGSLKNVVAIAAGISDGLNYGHNARAAIITRGLAEMTRIAVRMGANPMTLSGLAGIGDLILTCTVDLSRNRQLGLELGRGNSFKEILAKSKQAIEGAATAKCVMDLARQFDVELPICGGVHAILYESKDVRAAVADLLAGVPRREIHP